MNFGLTLLFLNTVSFQDLICPNKGKGEKHWAFPLNGMSCLKSVWHKEGDSSLDPNDLEAPF